MENATYIPGICNIGPAEIRRRRTSGIAGAIVTAGLLAATSLSGVPRPLRSVVVLPAAGTAFGFLQAATHFCGAFALRGVFNLGETGSTDTVDQAEFRAEDRRTALRLIAQSLAIGAGVGAVALALPRR